MSQSHSSSFSAWQWLQSFKDLLGRTATVDSAGRITVRPRQIYIIPTKAGLVFAVMVMAMLIGSNNYGINQGFALTFLLAGVGLSAMMQTWRNLCNLQIDPHFPAPVFNGETAKFPCYLHNTKSISRCGIQMRIRDSLTICDLPPGQGRLVTCSITTESRGFLDPGKCALFTYYPMSLFYAWVRLTLPHTCLVYPRPADSSVPLHQMFRPGILSELSDRDDADFAGHRKFQIGEPLSHMDWKARARGKGQLAKDFRQPRSEDIWLKWEDVIASDKEETLSILCRAVIELSRLNLKFGLHLPHCQLAPDAGKDHQIRCLTTLALFP